jgi:hypothetical protein
MTNFITNVLASSMCRDSYFGGLSAGKIVQVGRVRSHGWRLHPSITMLALKGYTGVGVLYTPMVVLYIPMVVPALQIAVI